MFIICSGSYSIDDRSTISTSLYFSDLTLLYFVAQILPALGIRTPFRGLLCQSDTFSSLAFVSVSEKSIRNQQVGTGVLAARGASLPADSLG